MARGMDDQRQKKGRPEAPADAATLALQDIFWAVLNSNEFILQH
jgi:hypothetical protein